MESTGLFERNDLVLPQKKANTLKSSSANAGENGKICENEKPSDAKLSRQYASYCGGESENSQNWEKSKQMIYFLLKQ